MTTKILKGFLLGAVALLAGCGSSPNKPVAVSISVTAKTLDQGQTATFTASTTNDASNSGVTWTVSGGGTLSAVTPTSVTYNAPATVSAVTTATLTATSVKTPADTASVTVTVNPAPAISATMLASATVNVAYTAALVASGGTAPITWTLSAGSLPPGFALSSAGVLSGTPTTIGSSTFTVKATDSASPALSTTQSLTLVVAPAPVVITTTSLSGAIASTAYSAALASTGGIAPINWTVSAGALPAGLTLSRGGIIAGSPSASGTFSFTVKASDSSAAPLTATQPLTLIVTPKLAITTSTLPAGTATLAYAASTLQATGGAGSITWAVSSGTLPAGLTLSSAGVLSGTPSVAGTSAFTVKATDSGVGALQQTATQALTLTIHVAPLVITTTTLPGGIAGSAFTSTLASTGGLAPITWTVSAGSLPAGITLSSAGVFSGTPSASGTFNVSVTAKDASATPLTATQALTLVITPALTISTTTLPAGTIAQPYAATTLQSAGGTGAVTWSLASGSSLPPGLILSAAGVISGTPTAVGVTTFTVKATDSGVGALQQTATKSLTITINSPVLTIATVSLPTGTAEVAYSQTLQSTGGTLPITWSATPLPTGLSLSTAGVLSGTPAFNTAGTYSITFTATDSGVGTQRQTTSKIISLTLNPPPTLAISTTALPNGVEGTSYAQTLQSSGGTGVVTWSLASGSLPPGLVLGNAGAVSGTPTTQGTFTFSVKATDSGTPQQSVNQALSITINQAATLSITTKSLPAGAVGVNYSQIIQVSGGVAPFASVVSGGALPAGLALSCNNGCTGEFVLSGTPTTQGPSTFTLKVVDSENPAQTASQIYTITINPAQPLAITTTTLPAGTSGIAYSAGIGVTGGTPPYSQTITSGALPTGLTITACTGSCGGFQISGTTSAAGTFSFTLKVTDSETPTVSVSQAYALVINPAAQLVIQTSSVPNGTVNIAYSAPIGVAGGTTPYTGSITAGTLPAGLSLINCSTGGPCTGAFNISGSPTAAGTFNFTLSVKDSETPAVTTTQTYTIVVAAATPLTILTTTLPSGTSGTSYSAAIGVIGGTTPYSQTITSGALPAGLTLGNCSGNCGGAFQITGTPNTAGTYSFTLKVTDSETTPVSVSQVYTLVINPVTPLTIQTTALPNGQATDSYGAYIQVTGGATPYSETLTAGALPPGLQIISCNGNGGIGFCINGTPTSSSAGTYTFTLKVTDSESPAVSVSQAYTLIINPATPLVIQSTSLPNGTQNTNYAGAIAVGGGATPYTEQVISGVLPPGISISGPCQNCNGYFSVSGTPTAAGTFTFTVKVSDATLPTAQTATQAYTITISPPVPLGIQTTALGGGTVNIPYNTTLQANGGSQPYTWSLIAGALPLGLSFNTTTGAIFGTPTTAGTSTFTVEVADSSTPTVQTATQTLTLAIAAAGVNDSELNGSYAFRAGGFNYGNTLGSVYGADVVGSFTADGNGNITSGLIDVNQSCPNCSPAFFEVVITGRYSIGADNRGIITFNGPKGPAGTYAVALSGLSGGVAHKMRVNEFDGAGTGTGEGKLQTTSAFSLSTIKGTFVFGFQGETPCSTCGAGGAAISPYGPVSAVGLFTADGTGNITAGQEDAAATGTTYSGVTLTGSVTAPSTTTGKGTITLTPAGTIYPAAPTNFIYYVVSSSEIYMMSEDSHATFTLLAGDVLLQQQTSFGSSALSGTFVAYENKADAGNGSSAYPNQSAASLLLITASGGQFNVLQDRNNAGSVSSSSQGPFPYTLQANGRVTLTGASAGSAPIFYLVNNNQGFGTQTAAPNNGGAGLITFEPQVAGPFTNSFLSGNFAYGDLPLVVDSSADSATLSLFGGSGTITQDQSDSSGTLISGQQFAFTYATDPPTGRVTIFAGGQAVELVDIISPVKAVGISLDTSSTTPTTSVIEK